MKRKKKEIAEDVEETIYMGVAWEGDGSPEPPASVRKIERASTSSLFTPDSTYSRLFHFLLPPFHRRGTGQVPAPYLLLERLTQGLAVVSLEIL
jgi:hypothetical protein